MPNLTGNTALDVAIGLAFVYLLFSILCAAVQEAIAGILDMRAATLERGLRNLLDDDGGVNEGGAPQPVGALPPATPAGAPVVPPPGPAVAVGAGPPAEPVAAAGAGPPAAPAAAGGAEPPPGPVAAGSPTLSDQVLGHGLIRTMYKDSKLLFKRKRRGPSYISPNTFALALLNVLAPANAEDPIASVRATLTAANIPAGTKSALLSLANGAASDRDELRKLIEHWFDGAMGRVSGWYKRKTQIIICVLSLVVAVGLNVNTVSIADRLEHDQAIRSAVVQQAVNSSAKTGDKLETTADNITAVQKLGLPLGWNKAKGDPARADLDHHLGRTLVGWLLTFLALSLGAPFWFDALGKLAGLRNAGKKPTSQGGATA